jgi:hypothetical protein
MGLLDFEGNEESVGQHSRHRRQEYQALKGKTHPQGDLFPEIDLKALLP